MHKWTGLKTLCFLRWVFKHPLSKDGFFFANLYYRTTALLSWINSNKPNCSRLRVALDFDPSGKMIAPILDAER